MSNDHIRPSTLGGIKQFAKYTKRDEGLSHTDALNKAARASGFENYAHARRALGDSTAPVKPGHAVYISVLWRDRHTKVIGQEVLKVTLGKPLDELLRPAQYKMARGLGTMRREGPDHLADTYTASSQDRARDVACQAARVLQFVEATGLVPSNAKRSYPKGDFQNRMPGSDHDGAWYDPAAKVYLRTNEPYSKGDITDEHMAWSARHGWAVALSPWKGMYNPDGGCCMFLTVDSATDYALEPLLAKLAAAPPPPLASEWPGESRPASPQFVSPGQAAEKEAKASAPKKARTPGTRNNSVEYKMILAGSRRRPKGRMPVEAHQAVGRLLKSVLIDTWKRRGAYRRVDAIRCELDNWVQCEYGRNELSDEVFHDLYYHELPATDPLAKAPPSPDRHVACLTEVKGLLQRHYPECAPLRDLLSKADLAISSLQNWKPIAA